MKLAYTHFANVDAHRARRYRPGDRLICYPRAIDGGELEPAIIVAERAYRLHHSEVDPEVWRFPAIAVGDVIVVGDLAVTVSPTGLEPVRVERSEVMSEGDWVNHIRTAFQRHGAYQRARRHLRSSGSAAETNVSTAGEAG